jgi:hypothetical protein
VGESPSARTQRELADLRRSIDRDADALLERVRYDVDPRNLVRRDPIAAAGTAASVALAATAGIVRRRRESRKVEGQVDAVIERLGGRIDRLKGKARKTFRKQLRKEMAEVDATGPKEVAWGAAAAALTALGTTMARAFAQRFVGDDEAEGRRGR